MCWKVMEMFSSFLAKITVKLLAKAAKVSGSIQDILRRVTDTQKAILQWNITLIFYWLQVIKAHDFSKFFELH